MNAREQVHKTYHSAGGCGASVGVLAFTSLFSHYKRDTHTGFGLFFFGQLSLWVFFVHTTPTYRILKVCTSFIDKCVSIIFLSSGCVISHPDRKTYQDRKGGSRAWSCAGP